MTVFDIIWIAVIVLWILRSISRASGGARAPEEADALPETEEETEARADWRERLMGAAREWELEQRRRAGEPVDVTSTRPQEARPPHRRSSVVIRDMTPERTGGSLVEAPPSEPPAPKPAPPEPRKEHRETVPEVTATPIERRPQQAAALPSALAALERQTPLRRAILYREIFGPPKALSDEG